MNEIKTSIKCPQSHCQGFLRRYPPDLLMSPAIKQYECNYCLIKYKQSDEPNAPLYTHYQGKIYDWAFICEMYEDIIIKLRKEIAGLKND